MQKIDTSILFVIPARSGSKGIKNKNIQKCGYDTLLRLSIKECLKLNLNANIYVSTDSQEYINHILDLIDNPPFLRPKNLSGDLIGDIEVLTHALIACQNFYKKDYSCIVMIQPTSPLRKSKDILNTINAIVKEGYDSAITCQKVDKKYHPLKSLEIKDNGFVDHFIPRPKEIIARQQLKSTYIRNGASYSITPKQLLEGKSFFKCKSKLVITDNIVSIDNIEELLFCERILLREKV